MAYSISCRETSLQVSFLLTNTREKYRVPELEKWEERIYPYFFLQVIEKQPVSARVREKEWDSIVKKTGEVKAEIIWRYFSLTYLLPVLGWLSGSLLTRVLQYSHTMLLELPQSMTSYNYANFLHSSEFQEQTSSGILWPHLRSHMAPLLCFFLDQVSPKFALIHKNYSHPQQSLRDFANT
jgi:hypothetical protein